MSIGENIAKYRKSKDLTQEQLGELLGVTNQAVSKWELGISMQSDYCFEMLWKTESQG